MSHGKVHLISSEFMPRVFTALSSGYVFTSKIESVDKETIPPVGDSRYGIVWQLSCWYEPGILLA